MTNDSRPRIAVIGAGIAGLACAATLAARGLAPVIFEKSRGLGGRIATRRRDDGLAFDHGAQFVTARSEGLRHLLDRARAAGTAAVWRPVCADDAGRDAEDWLIGAPTMNAWLKPLAAGLDLRPACEAVRCVRDGGGWRIDFKDAGASAVFDRVVCTAPAPQARVLAAAEADLVAQLAHVAIAPCWALLAAFDEPLATGWDVRRSATDALAWIARSTGKPGRTGPETWVAHASAAWSAEHLEAAPDAIAERLLALFARAVGEPLPAVRHVTAHRWRYALTTTPLGAPFAGSRDGTLLLGGDWCLGARVEYGYASGVALAGAVLESC